MDKNPVGSFEVKSGRMTFSDPCYTPGTWCMGSFPAKVGKWNAHTIMGDCGDWGNRVVQLWAVHESVTGDPVLNHTHDNTAGVDSGQCGFYDFDFYMKEGGTGEYDDESSFYGEACECTRAGDAAIIRGQGVVSRSGFGDGAYVCHVSTGPDGIATAARLTFIEEEEEEEEEDE